MPAPVLRNPATIAVVDDDAAVRQAIDSLVRALGYNALTFGSAEAFLLARITGLACLICDVQLPGISGIDLLARMSSEADIVPVILITAFPDASTERLARQGIPVLLKPFISETLALALARTVVPPA